MCKGEGELKNSLSCTDLDSNLTLTILNPELFNVYLNTSLISSTLSPLLPPLPHSHLLTPPTNPHKLSTPISVLHTKSSLHQRCLPRRRSQQPRAAMLKAVYVALLPQSLCSSLTNVHNQAFRWTLENANKVSQVLPTHTEPGTNKAEPSSSS